MIAGQRASSPMEAIIPMPMPMRSGERTRGPHEGVMVEPADHLALAIADAERRTARPRPRDRAAADLVRPRCQHGWR